MNEASWQLVDRNIGCLWYGHSNPFVSLVVTPPFYRSGMTILIISLVMMCCAYCEVNNHTAECVNWNTIFFSRIWSQKHIINGVLCKSINWLLFFVLKGNVSGITLMWSLAFFFDNYLQEFQLISPQMVSVVEKI